MPEQRGHRVGGVSLRRWPRADNIALLPAADLLLSSRSYWFITARSIYSRVGQSDELSSMRTLATYCGVSPLRMTMSCPLGPRAGRLAPVPSPFDPGEAGTSADVLYAPFSSCINQ